MKLKNLTKKSDILLTLYVDSDGVGNLKNINNCLYSIGKQRYSVDLLIFHSGLTKEEISTLEGYIKSPYLSLLSKDKEGKEEVKEIKLEKGEEINYTIEQVDAKSFPEIFNTGFNAAKENGYEFFSIAEQEDVFAIFWYEIAKKYSEEESENSVFLPVIRHTINGHFSGTINEASWVEGMAEVAGITDINLLNRFNSTNPLGALYKVSDIEEISEEVDGVLKPVKESIKLTHSYEFFLRMVYEDLKVKTIPRAGYELRVFDKEVFSHTSSKIPTNIGSLDPEKGGVSKDEVDFYLESAKKEYFYPEDRKKVFEQV